MELVVLTSILIRKDMLNPLRISNQVAHRKMLLLYSLYKLRVPMASVIPINYSSCDIQEANFLITVTVTAVVIIKLSEIFQKPLFVAKTNRSWNILRNSALN